MPHRLVAMAPVRGPQEMRAPPATSHEGVDAAAGGPRRTMVLPLA